MIYINWNKPYGNPRNAPPDSTFIAHTTNSDTAKIIERGIVEHAQTIGTKPTYVIELGFDLTKGQSWFYVERAQRESIADFLRSYSRPGIQIFTDKSRVVWKGRKLTEVEQEAWNDLVLRSRNLEI